MAKLHLGLSLLAGGLFIWACSTTKEDGFVGNPSTPGTTPGTVTGTSGGSPAIGPGAGIDTNDPALLADAGIRRPKVCDAAGNCTCMNLASLGEPASKSYGAAGDSTTAFETWLTTKSNAAVTFHQVKPGPITLEWLNNYDVIILQDLRKWSFSADEITAFQAWMAGGGGVMALSGYFSGDSAEIVPTNALLANTGMALLPAEVPTEPCSNDATSIATSLAVCPNSKANASTGKCYCWGGTHPLTEWNEAHPIKANLKSVGSFRGRQVDPGTTGAVVVSYGGLPVGATTQVGTGKLFIFGDEWITYTSQWIDGGKDNVTSDPNNPCYDTTGLASCQAGYVFQTMQFWFNSITYVSPPTECTFKLAEPSIIQ